MNEKVLKAKKATSEIKNGDREYRKCPNRREENGSTVCKVSFASEQKRWREEATHKNFQSNDKKAATASVLVTGAGFNNIISECGDQKAFGFPINI